MPRKPDMGNLKVRLVEALPPSCGSCDNMEAVSTENLFQHWVDTESQGH